jgi:hypothetical protein
MTDFEERYLSELRERSEYWDRARVEKLDLQSTADYEVLREYQPDTVVSLNVLEHIEDDQQVLDTLHSTVPDGCRIIFLVPYNPRLYSEFDRQIGHFRRYQRGELERKMEQAGFSVERQFFFNKVGVIAWWVGNTLTGQKTITSWQLKLYNSLTPLFRIIDRILPFSGLSTIVVARKAGRAHQPVAQPSLTAPATSRTA